MDENVFWLRLWQSMFMTMIIFGFTIGSCVYNTQKNYIMNGYCQKLLLGSTSPLWVKCETDK